eukprot:TRINITY_DN7633_c0_g1_i1.p1 TRINITY_DN7633_c0_g1~~TRINITY_DN7633_c0_g1_i1.p1  ORF type:complete len:310 (-),score=35.82 TRINITY_DN7633_c0_g1_i1:103-1032(-)
MTVLRESKLYDSFFFKVSLALNSYILFELFKFNMGNSFSVKDEGGQKFYPIPDNFKSLEDLTEALQNEGLEQSKIILGIDFSQKNMQSLSSNESLHNITENEANIYEEVITLLGKTLSGFNEDGKLPVYGFGDKKTEDKAVFPFVKDDEQLSGYDAVVQRYRQVAPHVQLYGPLSFAPLLIHATQIVKQSKLLYHILIIIASGSFDPLLIEENKKALVHSSKYPLSIVFIGVGDGPWHGVEYFDNKVSHRVFDNFQFVDFNRLKKERDRQGWTTHQFEEEFALRVLMEIPEQFKLIQAHHLMNPEMQDV